ncbi:MAG: hypothetical protein GX564_09665, partial [Oligosphaeraceae bacterium]|nr:hypothetical protein [Oligosphaeraceae bacterium]
MTDEKNTPPTEALTPDKESAPTRKRVVRSKKTSPAEVQGATPSDSAVAPEKSLSKASDRSSADKSFVPKVVYEQLPGSSAAAEVKTDSFGESGTSKPAPKFSFNFGRTLVPLTGTLVSLSDGQPQTARPPATPAPAATSAPAAPPAPPPPPREKALPPPARQSPPPTYSGGGAPASPALNRNNVRSGKNGPLSRRGGSGGKSPRLQGLPQDFE